MTARKTKKLDLVFSELERRILKKVWKVGDQIPTEMELSAEFKCSRSTIGMAIAQLERGGLVTRRTSAGTHVISNVSNQKPAQSLPLDAFAFVYPSDQHEGVWRTVRGFQQAAHAADRRAVLISTGANVEKEADIISRLGEFDIKGAVIFPMMIDPLNHAHYSQMIANCPFPIVLVEVSLPETRRPAVVVDGFDAGYVMTKHLLDRGLRKIGFLANYAWVSTTRDKHQGYRRAMTEAGVEDVTVLSLLEPEMHPSYGDPLREPTEIATRYLETHHGVEGVVCASDFLAVGLLRAAKATGLRVPEELKIAGMDDFALASEAGLTTYHIPYETIGNRAFQSLHDIKANVNTNGDVLLRGELTVRSST
jgi:GntR family transcriptional regulator, arabinose operon transcriptional repressor